MLWLKALHLIFMVTWFAGLFYLPRLFVYHAMSEDSTSIERFKVMERKLYYGIATPGGALTIVFGLWTIAAAGWSAYATSYWLHAKLFLVLLLAAYHIWCGKLMLDFKRDRNRHSHVWYRWFNEIPVIFLVLIIILAVVKPAFAGNLRSMAEGHSENVIRQPPGSHYSRGIATSRCRQSRSSMHPCLRQAPAEPWAGRKKKRGGDAAPTPISPPSRNLPSSPRSPGKPS